MTQRERVCAARNRHVRRLLDYPGVVWVGVGAKRTAGRRTGRLAVVVGVGQKRDVAPEATIPRRLRHRVWSLRRRVLTDVVESGRIVAL